MATTTTISELKINYLTQAQYDSAYSAGTINENEIYMIANGNTMRIGNATLTYDSTNKRLAIEVL